MVDRLTPIRPVHFAAIAGIATNAVAVGGMVAVSRVRISRYLNRANAEYFVPRGLTARITKGSIIHQVTGQPEDAPILSDSNMLGSDVSGTPDIISRRMQAFHGYIALLQYNELPLQRDESSTLDRLTTKMNAMKANRGKKKNAQGNDVSKHQAKLQESQAERQEEEQKIRSKAENKMARKPKDRAKIDKEMEKDLRKLRKDAQSDEEEYLEKSGKGGKKVDKKLQRLLFVTVCNVGDERDKLQ